MIKNIKNISSNFSQNKNVQQFHKKVVNQLTYHLKHYQQLHKKQKQIYLKQQPLPNPQQYLTPTSISHFLYDILQLQNASINFIMKQIFQSNKKTYWHIEQVLRIVLDVQFIITVNNFIVSKYEQSSQRKVNQQQIKFLKININELVDVLYQNCFFIKRPQNIIQKKLIQQIVQQINIQNGKKGYILLLQYKNFIFNNMIQKHVQKRKLLTPKKFKILSVNNINSSKFNNNKQKYEKLNTQSIKEVDQQSEGMGRSKYFMTRSDIGNSDIKLQQESKISVNNNQVVNNDNNNGSRISNSRNDNNFELNIQSNNKKITNTNNNSTLKQQRIKQLQSNSNNNKLFIQKNEQQQMYKTSQFKLDNQLIQHIGYNNNSQQTISSSQFRNILFKSLESQLSLNCININNSQNNSSRQLLIKLIDKSIKNRILSQRIIKKIQKYINTQLSKQQMIGYLIRILGEQSFKMFHDNKSKQLQTIKSINNHQYNNFNHNSFNSNNNNIFILSKQQVKQILIQAYNAFIITQNSSNTSTITIINNITNFIYNIQHNNKDNNNNNNNINNKFTFKDYLLFIADISSPNQLKLK